MNMYQKRTGKNILGENEPSFQKEKNYYGITLSPLWFLVVSAELIVGSCLQGYANNNFGAIIIMIILFLFGILIIKLCLPKLNSELRVFVMSYAVCIFFGGLVQVYSIELFNNAQSSLDARFAFYENIASEPPFVDKGELSKFNSSLAILVWQEFFKFSWLIGIKTGVFTGVMFNAFLIGITGSIVVRTAREIFGGDTWRLNRVCVFYSYCGLFILFGAVLLRDCYTTFLNTCVVFSIVCCLKRPSIKRIMVSISVGCLAAYAMTFLRAQSVVLFGVHYLIAVLISLNNKRKTALRIILIGFIFTFTIAGSGYINTYIVYSLERGEKGKNSYAVAAAQRHSTDSLGMQYVVNQPLPIRLLLGSASMMVNPIPMWAYFSGKSSDYHLIKGYNGLFQILFMPFLFLGYIRIIKMGRQKWFGKSIFQFLAIYGVINLFGVVYTTLEQRHYAQFMTVLIIISAIPDSREKKTRGELIAISMFWFGIVISVHIVWAIFKFQ